MSGPSNPYETSHQSAAEEPCAKRAQVTKNVLTVGKATLLGVALGVALGVVAFCIFGGNAIWGLLPFFTTIGGILGSIGGLTAGVFASFSSASNG